MAAWLAKNRRKLSTKKFTAPDFDFRQTRIPGMQLVVMLAARIEASVHMDCSAGTRDAIPFKGQVI